MKTTEELRYDALIRIRDLCILYNIPLMLILMYPPLRLALDNHIAKIDAARAINQADTTNLAAIKELNLILMIEIVFKFMLRSAVQASELELPELEISLDHPITYFTATDDDTVSVRCEAIKKIMKTNLTTLTCLTAGDITDMEAAILAYNNSNKKPKEAIDNRKTKGTDEIVILLNAADPTKNNIGKVFHSYLPDAADLFDKAAFIGKSTGIRHTSIAIQILDSLANMPLKGVKITATNGTDTFEKLTTAKGWIRLYSLPNAIWNITIEYPNYITQHLLNIPSIDSKMTLLKIKLVKIQPPLPTEEDTPPVTTPPPTDENPAQRNT